MIDEGRVRGALSTVRDPELDEPLTDLGFVRGVEIDGGSVTVTLWLPTFWCAPNFAYLMAGDAKAAVGALPGVGSVHVTLVDHHAADEINDGLAGAKDFDETFPDDTAGTGLADLRSLFDRKAFVARQWRLYRSLLDAGTPPGDVVHLKVDDLPDTVEARQYLERRAWMGIDTSGEAPFLVTPDGKPIPEAEVERHMRFGRTVSVSIEGNASLCRGLLASRYGTFDPKEVRA